MTGFEEKLKFAVQEDSPLTENERATSALISLLGGLAGMQARGIHFTDFAKILHADPTDDLSGLRDIADALVPGRPLFMTLSGTDESEEPIMTPEDAHRWLTQSSRATEHNGVLQLNEGEQNHITLAGYVIALGSENRYLSDS